MLGVTLFFVPLMAALHHGRIALAMATVNALANVIAFLAFAPLGVIGIAIGFTVRGLVMLPVQLWVLSRYTEVSISTLFRRLRALLVSCCVMVVTVWALGQFVPFGSPWAYLASSIVLGVVVFATTILVLDKKLLSDFRSLHSAML